MAWPWDWFDALGTELDAILGLPWALADIAMQVVYVLLYPFIYAGNLFLVMSNEVIFPFVAFINNIIGLSNTAGEMVHVFDGVFPSEWTYLLGAAITINIILRIYSLVPLVGRGK